MTVDSSCEPQTTVTNCTTHALKEERAQFHNAPIEERNRERNENKRPQRGGNNNYNGTRNQENN